MIVFAYLVSAPTLKVTVWPTHGHPASRYDWEPLGRTLIAVRRTRLGLMLAGAAVGLSACGGPEPQIGSPTTSSTTSTTTNPAVAAGFDCQPSAPTGQASNPVTVSFDGTSATYQGGASDRPGEPGYPGALTISTAAGATTAAMPGSASHISGILGLLCVVAFGTETDGHPEVLLSGFTEGAHCCFNPTLYAYVPSAGRYEQALDLVSQGGPMWDNNVGLGPMRDGTAVILQTRDGRFLYFWGPYADTPAPPLYYVWKDSQLVDVTAQHLSLVQEAADSVLQAVPQREQNGSPIAGLAVGWLADECLLGRGASSWSQVQAWARQGVLGSVPGAGGQEPTPPAIASWLLEQGYCQGQLPS